MRQRTWIRPAQGGIRHVGERANDGQQRPSAVRHLIGAGLHGAGVKTRRTAVTRHGSAAITGSFARPGADFRPISISRQSRMACTEG